MEERKKIIVIKYGGHAMDLPELRSAFGSDLCSLQKDDWRFVIIHGGGPHIAALLDKMRLQSAFVDGLRVTDSATLEAVEMALCGQVNKDLTRQLEKIGISAVGISGEDGPILIAKVKNPALGRVGEVTEVRPELINYMLQGNYTPVIAPLGLDENFEPLNINADTAAGAIAGALCAHCFVLVSDVPGVLDGNGNLIPELDRSEIDILLRTGIIKGGMIPKIQACLEAIAHGCQKAIILDGRQKGNLKNFLLTDKATGTVIIAD